MFYGWNELRSLAKCYGVVKAEMKVSGIEFTRKAFFCGLTTISLPALACRPWFYCLFSFFSLEINSDFNILINYCKGWSETKETFQNKPWLIVRDLAKRLSTESMKLFSDYSNELRQRWSNSNRSLWRRFGTYLIAYMTRRGCQVYVDSLASNNPFTKLFRLQFRLCNVTSTSWNKLFHMLFVWFGENCVWLFIRISICSELLSLFSMPKVNEKLTSWMMKLGKSPNLPHQLEAYAQMISEVEVVEHVDDVVRAIRIFLAQLIKNSNLDECLVVEALFVANDFDCDILISFVVERTNHLTEASLSNHFQYFIAVADVVMNHLREKKF